MKKFGKYLAIFVAGILFLPILIVSFLKFAPESWYAPKKLVMYDQLSGIMERDSEGCLLGGAPIDKPFCDEHSDWIGKRVTEDGERVSGNELGRNCSNRNCFIATGGRLIDYSDSESHQ